MADLDVAVRLKFLTLGEGKIKAAAKDVAAFGKSVQRLSGSATGRLGGDLDRAWRASAKLGGSLDKTAIAADKLGGRATGKFASELGKALTASTKLGDAIGKTAIAVDKLGGKATGKFAGELGKAWTVSAKLGGSLDKTAVAAGKSAAGLQKIGAAGVAIDATRRKVDQLAKSTTALGSAERKVRATAFGSGAAGAIGGAAGGRRKTALKAGFAEAASRVSPGAGYLLGAGTAVAVGAGIGATAAAGIGGAALLTKEAIDRDKAMAEVRKKVNLEEGDSYEALGRRISGVARKIGISYAAAASVFAQGGQGNVATADLEEFALLGAKVSAAWDVGAKEAAQTLTEVKAQTGWTIPQLQNFADKVNFLGDISAAAERDVAAMFARASAGAKAAGVSFDDSLVTMTALRAVGMQDEVAARFFGQITAKLRNATGQSKKAKAAFKELGLTPEGVAKGMQTDAMGTMIDFLERLSKSENAVSIATAIGGEGWFDELLRMKDALGEIKRLRAELASGRANGSLDKALEVDLNTTVAKWSRAWQAWLDVGAQQTKGMLPVLDAIADKITSINEKYLKATEAERIMGKAGKEKLSPDEMKRVMNDPELRERFVAAEGGYKPSGRSISDYEREHGLDRPIKAQPPALFAQIERSAPHLATVNAFGKAAADMSLFGSAAEKATDQAGDLYGALEKLNTTVNPQVDTAIIGNLQAIEAEARRTKSALDALKTFGAPTTGTRLNPSISGRGGGGSPGGGQTSPATPGKQARRGDMVHIGAVHVHGVRNLAALEREIDRKVRSARANALHDIG